jgi:hypothetical protein
MNREGRRSVALYGLIPAGFVGLITLLFAWKLAVPAAIVAAAIGSTLRYRAVSQRISEDVIAPGVFRRTWEQLVENIGEDARVIGTLQFSLAGAIATSAETVAEALRALATLVQTRPESVKDALQIPYFSRRIREELNGFVENGQPNDARGTIEELLARAAEMLSLTLMAIRLKDAERIKSNAEALRKLLEA